MHGTLQALAAPSCWEEGRVGTDSKEMLFIKNKLSQYSMPPPNKQRDHTVKRKRLVREVKEKMGKKTFAQCGMSERTLKSLQGEVLKSHAGSNPPPPRRTFS